MCLSSIIKEIKKAGLVPHVFNEKREEVTDYSVDGEWKQHGLFCGDFITKQGVLHVFPF